MDERENDTCEVPYSKLLGSNRLLSFEEAKSKEPGRMAWVEIKNSNFIFRVDKFSIPDKYFDCGYYRRRWRLWAEEPSEELRERTEWDDLERIEAET